MTVEEARDIYLTIRSSEHDSLVDEMIRCAVRYAQLRVEWELSSIEERIEMDPTRSRAHDAFIDACNILSRNMSSAGEDNSWRETIGSDRKSIGDFACMLHYFLGIKAR